MLHKLPENLKIELIDNKITNTQDLLLAISKENNLDMLSEYHNFLTNHINISSYEDLDVILFALKSQINKLETTKKIKEEFKNIKKINRGLERISLIEDLKENNDSKKDMYYLKYTNKDGSMTILEISNNKTLLKLITTVAPTMNGEEFMKHLKERYFRELPTYNMGKDKINILEYEHASIIPDKTNYKVEKEILSHDYPDIVPEVSIDSNQERLYHIGSTIIKFHDEYGKRQKVILNSETKKENSNDEIKHEEHTTNLYNSEKDTIIKRSELDNIDIEVNDAVSLIKQYSLGKNLEKTDQLKVYSFLLETLSKLEAEQTLSNIEEDLLSISINYLNTKEPNNIEQEILNRYNEHYYTIEKDRQEMNKDSKKKTYGTNQKSPLILTDDGISLTIIIITVTVLVGSLIATILLVK